MYHLFFLDYFMLPDMVVSGNVTCAALQQAAASGEVDHDLWGREHAVGHLLCLVTAYIYNGIDLYSRLFIIYKEIDAFTTPEVARRSHTFTTPGVAYEQGWLTRDSKKPLIFRKKM